MAEGSGTLTVQLYTLRDDTAKDFPGTLKQVADAGFAAVEFAGYGKHTPAELRTVLDGLGLKAAGAHVGLHLLEGDLDQAIEDVVTLGASNIACPYLTEDRRKSADDYKRLGEQLSKIGERCKQAGLQLSYHNHDFEFQKFDGKYGLDILFDAADPTLLNAELDLGWVMHAGVDPVAYVHKYSGRVPTLHFKDMSGRSDFLFAPTGEGILPLAELVTAGRQAGAEYFIVEQDLTEGPAIDAVRTGAKNLQALGVR